MPTAPLESILYRELSKAQAKPDIELASGVLQELVNFASNALVRCATSTEGEENEDLAVLSLYRHIMEMTDGVEVLISESGVTPAVPLIRSSFEALISMEYIVEDDARYLTRSLAWLVDYVHQRLHLYESLDPSTSRGQEFRQALNQDNTVKTIAIPLQPSVKQAIGNLQDLLAKPQLAAIHLELTQLKGQRKWYRLYAGPDNIRELAHHVGRGAQYDFLYRYWSRVSHAHDFAPFIASTPDGRPAIRGIRDPSDLKNVANFAASFMLGATRVLIGKFRPGEDIRTWYVRDVRPGYIQLSSRP
jgi:hypothetical protein